MVVCVHLPQDTERTIIPYLNKEETLEGLLNEKYRTWKNKLTNHPETRGKIFSQCGEIYLTERLVSYHLQLETLLGAFCCPVPQTALS